MGESFNSDNTMSVRRKQSKRNVLILSPIVQKSHIPLSMKEGRL